MNKKILFGFVIVLVFVINMFYLVNAQTGESGASGGDAVKPIIKPIEIDLYKFIDNIVKNGGYTIVLGDDGSSMDTLSASEINIKFQQYSDLETNLNVELASLIEDEKNLILIGHPCDNPLIKGISCEDWSYEIGQALIKIDGDNLIIAGTTKEDTKNAAGMVANYKDYRILKGRDEIIIKREVENGEVMDNNKSSCGDGICDDEENCETDCMVKSSGSSTVNNLEEEKKIVGEVSLDEEKNNISLLRKVWRWFLELFEDEE